MKIPPFKLEKFFQKWEFKTPFILSASDNESLSLKELLDLADDHSRFLWENLQLGYTEVSGHPKLRREISKLYQQVNENGIGVFAGAGEALFGAFNFLIQPRDHVIAPALCYKSLIEIPLSLGADVSLYPIRNRKGEWYFDIEDLLKLLRPNTKLIVINFPHNPTSAHIDQQTLEKIVECARKSDSYLFSDEVYRFSEHQPEKRLPPAADLYEKALSIGVMSKTFGLAGTRIGWLATQDQELMMGSLGFKCYLSLCNSAPSEILSIIALREKEKIIERNLQIISENLNLLDSFFHHYKNHFEWKRPIAGSTAFPRLLIDIPIDQFVEGLIEEEGVLLLPGSVYDYAGNYFRIGFSRKNMPEALDHFDHYLKRHFKA